MLTNVFTKTTLDRWKPPVIAAVSLAVLLLFGMAVYRGIDVSFWDDLPEAFRSVFGIPAGADVGGLAYGAIYSGYGILTMAAVAVAGGAVSIAGEEKNGTIGLLLGDPVSRTTMALSKAAALAVVTAGAFIILWLTGLAAPMMLDVEIGTMDVNALIVMMFVNALFYGFFAFALSGWTGKSALAAGVSAGVMVVSFIAVGLLPLIDEVAGLAKFFPWYYFSGSEPLLYGISWRDFGILAAGVVVFLVIGVVGVNRRDLRSQSVGTKMIDRLRANPLTHKAAEMLAGTARVSKIWIKTASEHQALLYVIVPVVFLMSVMIGPMYSMLDDTLKSLGEQFPETLLSLFGGGDMSTPEGFYQIEMFGLMIPISILVVTIVIGTAALAGEEKHNTMGLLLANPVRRSTVVTPEDVDHDSLRRDCGARGVPRCRGRITPRRSRNRHGEHCCHLRPRNPAWPGLRCPGARPWCCHRTHPDRKLRRGRGSCGCLHHQRLPATQRQHDSVGKGLAVLLLPEQRPAHERNGLGSHGNPCEPVRNPCGACGCALRAKRPPSNRVARYGISGGSSSRTLMNAARF